MNKYEILYYHYGIAFYNRLFVIANSKDDAKRLFGLIHPVDWIEEIFEYEEPEFWTEDAVKKMLKNW